ncbi:DUF1259 domain-containing protein [Shouchella miscanthi]|uniref:DUF1259 domain-containing protein n=1 Tax=Shouchella miscanthi TaxID=2598861 RepID=A0ABU6NSL2_9BACI|nr:DUF1259 domain-containing protein [Shouchella miscanthi]
MYQTSLCQQCALLLNGTASESHGLCSIMLPKTIDVRIQGRPSKGAVHSGITFESIDQQGNALNLGEVVLREEELQPFSSVLLSKGIILSAIHNHWIFTEPNLLYVHFQSIEPPLSFAQKVAEAFRYVNP